MRIRPLRSALRGELTIPGDKSVTHRAIMFASIAKGDSLILGGGDGADNVSTAHVMQQLGVDVRMDDAGIHVRGVGLHGLKDPKEVLDCGNSGTTARILVGLLAGAGINATLIGDDSLSGRPMARVADPLRELGYTVETTGAKQTMPMSTVQRIDSARDERAVRAVLNVASAQVKSCVMVSGLFRHAETEVVEPAASRDHTERLLRAMGRRVESTPHYMDPVGLADDDVLPTTRLYPGQELRGGKLEVPGDFSSAAFMIAAGLIAGERVVLKNVNTNPTRVGMLHVLERMGAKITQTNRRVLTTGEPVADMIVEKGPLRGTVVQGAEIPLLIDEIPVLAVVGAMADGVLEIRDAKELRVKESDRVETTAAILEGMGIRVDRLEDGLRVHGIGRTGWSGFRVDSEHDHRVAMAAAVAALGCTEDVIVDGSDCINISYPTFSAAMRSLGADMDDPGTPV